MAAHKKNDLFLQILDAIIKRGWIVKSQRMDVHPLLLHISKGDIQKSLRIYIWNVSHGGGEKRPKNEYRIQITGITQFQQIEDETTLILGWYNELKVFVAFDYNMHHLPLGKSPSLQVKEEVITRAISHGYANEEKENGEIVVAFKPEFFIDYISSIENWHTYILPRNIYEETVEDDAENEKYPYRYSVTSYGVDYTVDTIVKRLKDEAIYVPPFQRKFVWSQQEASRFIESLLLGLPVPGVFLSKEADTGRQIIIDGQQRLLSIFYFYIGAFKGKRFTLTGVEEDLEGKSYSELDASDRLRLDDSVIHATIVKQTAPEDGDSSIYLIFERLNTGGKKLTSQEIRACIYYGDFNELLNTLVEVQSWREIFGKPDERLKEQELVLRFFALYFKRASYSKPLKLFLNSFMSEHRHLNKISASQFHEVFENSIDFMAKSLGRKAFRLGAGINAAVFDSMLIGVSERLKKGTIKNIPLFIERYEDILSDPAYIALIRGGTSDEANLSSRMNLCIENFRDLV